MGTFNVDVQIAHPTGEVFATVEALVDTGATYTMMPATLLRSLGIEPHRTSRFETADGRVIEMQVGRARLRLGDQEEVTLVVFGDDGVEPLIGAVALEDFLLAPDPIRGTLVPIAGLLRGLRLI